MLDELSATGQVVDAPAVSGATRVYADGEMAGRIRRFAWAGTSVGAISKWPDTLVWAVNLILESRFPTVLFWGPEMAVFYNDAYQPLMAEKHPRALGRPARDVWSEAWHIVGPQCEAVMEQGRSFHFEDVLVPNFRHGALCDVYWTYSYSPLRDTGGRIGGVFVVCHDVTAKLAIERERDAIAANLKNVLESTTDGLVVLDRQGRYTYVNEQAARIVAQRPEDMVGRSQWELFPHALETEFGRQYREAVATGGPRHFDSFYPEPLNTWFECHCYPSEHGVSIYFRDVTEQKQTEKALRASESRFRKLFESDMMGIAIPDRFGAFRESNDELLRMTGYTRADLEAGLVRWDTMTPSEYADLDLTHIREAAVRGSCTPYEKEYIRKDGTRVPILCGYALLEGSEDEYIGFVLDLSEQKRAERGLREREERFRLLAESLPQLIWIANAAGENLYCNPRYLDFLGVSEADRASIPWLELIHPDDLAFTLRIWNHSVETGEPYLNEFRLRRKDGMFRYFLARAVPLMNAAGEIERWIGSLTDIQDQKLAERELREREERFRLLSESLPQLIWMTDAAGGNIYCNRRFIDYFGLAETEIMGQRWRDLIHPGDLAATLEIWSRSLLTGEPYLNEYRLRRRDGLYRYFLARAVPLKNAAGEIERWIGSSTDIHDQKLAEDALRRSEKLATAGRLAASIAHEINNPLAAVTNSLYLALQDGSLNPDTKSYLQTAEQELLRVAHITTQTLRFHKQSTSPSRVDICDLVDSVLALFARRLANKKIHIRTECQRGSVAVCFADEVRQVIANLVGNALDATSEGGTLRLRVKKARRWTKGPGDGATHGVRIVVADTGHGIPPAVLDRIFEPFTSTKDETGIGLGLWVSDGIVRKHGGAIRVRSKARMVDCESEPAVEPAGTVFTVFIPMASANP